MNKRSKKQDNYFFHTFVRLTGVIPALLWLRPKIYHLGDKNSHKVKGSVVVIANHVSFIDPMTVNCIMWRRRVHSLATKDLYRTKLMSFFLNATLCIQVDKENFSIRSLHGAVDRLRAGKAILIFPEGHINFDNEETQSFKEGAVLMAHLGNAVILPIHLHKRKRFFNRTYAAVGDPIDIKNMCGAVPTMEELHNICNYVRDKELELQEFLNAQLKEKGIL